MTVKKFKQLVNDIPESQDEWLVVISKDPEGNEFNEFHDLSRDDDGECSRYYDEPSELWFYNEDDYESFEEFREIMMGKPHLKPCIVLWR